MHGSAKDLRMIGTGGEIYFQKRPGTHSAKPGGANENRSVKK